MIHFSIDTCSKSEFTSLFLYLKEKIASVLCLSTRGIPERLLCSGLYPGLHRAKSREGIFALHLCKKFPGFCLCLLICFVFWKLHIFRACVCVLSCFICVQLFVTLWTVAHQAPLSLGFSRWEYWRRLLFPSPGDPPDPEIEPASPGSPALQAVFNHWATEEILWGHVEGYSDYIFRSFH